jgi:hypothetical protein
MIKKLWRDADVSHCGDAGIGEPHAAETVVFELMQNVLFEWNMGSRTSRFATNVH